MTKASTELSYALHREVRIGDIVLLKKTIVPGSIEDTVVGFFGGWADCQRTEGSNTIKGEGMELTQSNPNNISNLIHFSNWFDGKKHYIIADFNGFEILRSTSHQKTENGPDTARKDPDDRRDNILSNDPK